MKKKFEIKKQVKNEEPIIPKKPEPFVTTDNNLVEKLQNNFSIKNVSLDKDTGKRTFTFNASKEEIEKYIKEGKC